MNKKKADTIFSNLIRKRGYCQRCTKSNVELDCAHVFSRKFLSVRWDVENAFCLCRDCHSWGHRYPKKFKQFVLNEIGYIKYSSLKKKKNTIKKWNNEEIDMLIKDLKEKYEQ